MFFVTFDNVSDLRPPRSAVKTQTCASLKSLNLKPEICRKYLMYFVELNLGQVMGAGVLHVLHGVRGWSMGGWVGGHKTTRGGWVVGSDVPLSA